MWASLKVAFRKYFSVLLSGREFKNIGSEFGAPPRKKLFFVAVFEFGAQTSFF
jgi:hypothetical protein